MRARAAQRPNFTTDPGGFYGLRQASTARRGINRAEEGASDCERESLSVSR
jgi:hypothetical protein